MNSLSRVFVSLLACAATGLVTSAGAAELKLDTVEDSLLAARKIQCSTQDGEAIIWYWNGHAYSRVPGEPDRQLFAVEGINVRQCGPLDGATDGSFKMTTREVLLYEDPQTGKPLETWTNPWTGKELKVLHVANDPVNQRLSSTGRDGRPFSMPLVVNGDQWWMTATIPLFYRNALGGDYQDHVGGKYHATEMFNYFGDVESLADPAQRTAKTSIGWVRLSGWLPWMEMGDRVGMLYFSTAGRKVDNWQDMPEAFRKEIETNYPLYRNPPPLDDERPNETSWTYFKKMVPVGQ